MEKILTIGIPVYNMERYLDRCLSSVTGISNLDKVEIIVVNDGSKDRSLAIARTYEQRFPESVRVIDKPNGGWGTAINTLISQANGKYFKSLDSDDWFDTNELDRFITTIEQIDVDLIITDYTEVDEAGNKKRITAAGKSGIICPTTDFIISADYQIASIHGVAYNTQMLKQNKFCVEPKFYADLDYILTPLQFVTQVYVDHINVYQYYYGRPGQSVSIEGYNKHFKDYINVTRKLIPLIEKNATTNPILHSMYLKRIFGIAISCYRLLMMTKYQGKNHESKAILKSFDEYIKIESPSLYRAISKKKAFGMLPYISIWRLTGINIFQMLNI